LHLHNQDHILLVYNIYYVHPFMDQIIALPYRGYIPIIFLIFLLNFSLALTALSRNRLKFQTFPFILFLLALDELCCFLCL
jgi:hypothetical protein